MSVFNHLWNCQTVSQGGRTRIPSASIGGFQFLHGLIHHCLPKKKKKKKVPPVNIKCYLVFFPLIFSPPPIIDVKYIFVFFWLFVLFLWRALFLYLIHFISYRSLYFLPDSVSLVGKAIATQSVTGLTYLSVQFLISRKWQNGLVKHVIFALLTY